MWYPLTRICPVYWLSIGAMFSLVVDPLVDLEILALDDDVGSGDRLKTLAYVSIDRAGRFRARAALCRSGETVEEKLYGTEALSMGWTWDVKIFTFSST